MKLKLLFASAFAAASLFAACTTESSDPTQTELLLAKTWKLTGITATPALIVDGDTITDVYASDILSDCDKHQKRKYNADGSLTFSNDSAACGMAGSGYGWTLTGSTLTTTEPDSGAAGGVQAKTNTLVSINSNTMVLSWNVTASESPDGAVHVATETYTAQ